MGLIRTEGPGSVLTGFGKLLAIMDPNVDDIASWWALHWRLAARYRVWGVLSTATNSMHEVSEIDDSIRSLAPSLSDRTVTSARRSLVKALEDTPLGRELGLVELHSDGRRVTGLTKLPVRHGGAPLAAVAYAMLDWARREGMTSAALETLAGPHGPGPVLHMSEGVLERYLVEIDGAFRGRVLSYSRTAGLNEAYIKDEVTPLQVLAAHYIHTREGLAWPEALERACGEVADDEDAD